MKKASFYIEDMSCQACSSGIERALNRKSFCKNIEVNLLSKKAHICYDDTKVSIEDIFALIRKMGYVPHFGKDSQPKPISNSIPARINALIESFDNKFLSTKTKLVISICATLFTLILSWGEMLHIVNIPFAASYYSMLFLSLVVMHMGRGFYIRGFKALFMRNPNMDSLIAIGTSSAFLYSLQGIFIVQSHTYFDSVCVIITLVLVGKSIENKSKQEAIDSASLLLKLNQKNVQKVCFTSSQSLSNAPCENIPTQDVKEGDILKVLPGEMIMVDSIILEGESSLDTSSVNGESIPMTVSKNDILLSGSINLDSVLYIKAQKNARQSTLAQILQLVQYAKDSKAPIASLADKVAGVFVPLVIFLALCAGAFWWGMVNLEFALSIFIATLVISCPCALGLATPMAILHAQSISNKMGVFFKDAKSLQNLSDITHVAFDKTGTLTQGLNIDSIYLYDKTLSEQDIFSLAYTIESTSNHVISLAFRTHHLSKNATLLPISNVENVLGSGIKATIDNKTYMLGSLALIPPHLQPPQKEEDKITLYLATDEKLLAQFCLQDYIKPDATLAIESFRQKNIECSLISGDNAQNTSKIASRLNITDFNAKAMPEDKMRLLKDKATQHKVLMVGDGINDAPALAYAHTSAAFISSNDIATQSADIVIYNTKVMSVYNAYALAKATISNIKQNLVFAFCYNIALIPLAMGVLGGFGIFLHPMFCAFAMSISSISVVFNSTRLKRFKIL